MTAMDGDTGVTLYEAVGGDDFFGRLVDEFYAGVADDEVLAPLYPEHAAIAVADGRRPGSAQVMLQRQGAEIRPERIGGDVLGDDGRAAKGGRPAGAARRTDRATLRW